MAMSLDMVKAFFDSKNLKYREVNNGKTISVGFSGMPNAGSVEILVFFDEDDGAIALRSFNLLTVSDDLKPKMYKVCSELNMKFRWVKFFVDDNDNTVTVADDAVTQLDSVGEEAFELVIRMTRIIDDAYPVLMKAKFA